MYLSTKPKGTQPDSGSAHARAPRHQGYNYMMYSSELLDHFQNPRNAGELDRPDVSVQVENPVCGDVLRLSANIREGRIVEIRFKAKGCVPAMACASAVTELVAGRTIQDARTLRNQELIQTVGALPEASAHAAVLATDALASLLKEADTLK